MDAGQNLIKHLDQKENATFCNSLEDEFHFILECPLYHELRIKYIKTYYWNRPNILKFIELFKSENEVIVKNVSQFVEISMKKEKVCCMKEHNACTLIILCFQITFLPLQLVKT